MEEKLLDLISESERVLITSHMSPDTDAISSVLLLGTALEKNFPDKTVNMVLEEEPTRNLGMVRDYKKISFEPLIQHMTKLKPDLFIMVDVANFRRVSRDDGDKIKNFVADDGVKTAIIDHHEEVGRDNTNIYINDHLPATVQQIYQLAFVDLKLKKPDGYADTTLLGILADTNRFKYQNPKYRQTFSIVSELLDAGASIERLETVAEQYDKAELDVLAELLKNSVVDPDGYNYSFLDDAFIDRWQKEAREFSGIKNGSDLFTNNYLRNIEQCNWGFVLYREYPSGSNIYSARFRAVEGKGDMSKLAAKLGGGGHIGAAGAKFEAKNLQDALRKVRAAIEQNA